MLFYKRMALALVIITASIIILLGSIYNYMIAPVSKNKNLKMVEIKEGSNVTQIANTLKDNHLIKNVLVFKLYVKMNDITNLKAGYYNLSESMNLKTITNMINNGRSVNPNSINITFPEGKNMRQLATIIENKTNNTKKDVYDLLKDSTYIDSLIKKYWFLSDEIKNKDIYYPLEGYLFPNTYNFDSKDVTVSDIFSSMLNETDKVLSKYKSKIEEANYSVHEILTLASIVENEGVNDKDRPMIAGVFYNRLFSHWSLGSCATDYYALKLDIGSNPNLTNAQMAFNSPYNTYLASMAGKLPIGPISNPGEASISATISPTKHDYYYFLSDNKQRTYFSKNITEHEAKKQELIDKGEWERWQ
jgi:UPF0755 protein